MMNNDKGMNSSPLRMKPYLSEKVVSKKGKRKPLPGPVNSSKKPLPVTRRKSSTSRTGSRGY